MSIRSFQSSPWPSSGSSGPSWSSLTYSDQVPYTTAAGWYQYSATTTTLFFYGVEVLRDRPVVVGDVFNPISDTLSGFFAAAKGSTFSKNDLYLVTSIGSGTPSYTGATVSYISPLPATIPDVAAYLGITADGFIRLPNSTGITIDDSNGDLSRLSWPGSYVTKNSVLAWLNTEQVFLPSTYGPDFNGSVSLLQAALPLTQVSSGRIDYCRDGNAWKIRFLEVNYTSSTGNVDYLVIPGCTNVTVNDTRASGGITAVSAENPSPSSNCVSCPVVLTSYQSESLLGTLSVFSLDIRTGSGQITNLNNSISSGRMSGESLIAAIGVV